MRAPVERVFIPFTNPLEGCVLRMYTDGLNLVTVGRGNLIDGSARGGSDPAAPALPLPWTRLVDGGGATDDEIRAEWLRVKQGGFAHTGWRAAAAAAALTLSQQAVDDLTIGKLHSNDAELRGRFDGWETLPAAVQLAVHSMAWACGSGFRFPRFAAALAARDWGTYSVDDAGKTTPLSGCILECHLDETGNRGLVPRNAAQVELFAAVIDGCGVDEIPGWL